MLSISLVPNKNRPTSPTPGIVRLDGTKDLGKFRDDAGQTAHEGVERRLGSPQIKQIYWSSSCSIVFTFFARTGISASLERPEILSLFTSLHPLRPIC